MDSMESGPARLVSAILESYALDPWGIHGLAHWARVLETGLRLAEATGANPAVVRLFAFFHDAKRLTDGTDDGHGRRGAAFAALYKDEGLALPAADFARLETACTHHTDTVFHEDPTIQTCWDADRLDLPRVRTRVDPRFLGTAAAKERDVIDWAGRRARDGHIPELIRVKWGIGG
jgi:uncharacterized protein